METSQQQRGSTLGQFTQILKDAKLDFDALDLIDTLWLAQFMEPSVDTAPSLEPENNSSVEVEFSKEIKTVDSLPQDALNLYVKEPPSPSPSPEPQVTPSTQPEQPRGMPFAVPTAPALRTKRNLARALRPLMLKVPSPNQLELDEDASVSQIAATEVWMPVFRAKTERWLELDFVVESSKTTVIWEQAIAELKQLAEYQGAFRTVRTWRLSSQGERLQLFPRWSNELSQLQTNSQGSDQQSPHTPKELIDPSGRRLIWLVTDCTSELWQKELIYQTLADWANGQPVAIVQLFPQHLWSRTALRNGHIVRLSALKPGSPSNYLTKEGLPQILEPRRATGLITIPIVTLDPESMRTWARVVSGCGDSRTPGRTFDLVFISRQAQRTKTEPPPTSQPTRTAQERVDFFRATASETTQKLANLMAATPVSLPVIDLLREEFRGDFSEEVQQYHVVEVLLSGLLRRCDQEDEQICRYEFFGDRSSNREERVRDILLGDTSISQTMRVLDVLSGAICSKLGGPSKSFLALLEDLKSLNTQEGQTVFPFARIGLDVLRCLGGEYTDLANQHQRTVASAVVSFPSPSPRPVPPVTPPVTPPPPKPTASPVTTTPRPTPQPSPSPEIALLSSRGINYTRLRDLLAQGKWKKADQETTALLLRVSNREKEGWLTDEDVKNLSCEDLRTMDRLWVAYSQSKFGFSIQREIYQSLGGTGEYNVNVENKFGERVGWRVNRSWIYYKDVTFDLNADRGHLPWWVFVSRPGWGGMGRTFFLRSVPCEL